MLEASCYYTQEEEWRLLAQFNKAHFRYNNEWKQGHQVSAELQEKFFTFSDIEKSPGNKIVERFRYRAWL